MQNVPNIVRERLKATTPAVNHPDADVLTAFAERSLPGLERAIVLEHLARCGECRDIVALALPASEPVQAVFSPPPRAWMTWPGLRWGFVAAGVIAIASLGVLRYQHRFRPANMASAAPAHVEVAVNKPKEELARFAADQAAEKRDTDKVQSPAAPGSFDSVNAVSNEKKTRGRAEAILAPPSQTGAQAAVRVGSRNGIGVAANGQLPHGPRLANQWQQQNQVPAAQTPALIAKQQAAAQTSPNMPVPPSSQMVEVQSEATTADNKAGTLDESEVQNVSAAPQPAREDSSSDRVGKAKAPVTTTVANGNPPMPATAGPATLHSAGALASFSAQGPRWTISSAGTLQRSFDQGNSWQDVDVTANRSYMSAASLEVSAEKSSRAKAKDAGKALKQEIAAPTFRVVAATGPDVWAGGSALYHSVDGGNRWIRVVPASSGTLLTGDVIRLEFSDAQHGKVSTSTSEAWTTSDDGQTWQKQ